MEHNPERQPRDPSFKIIFESGTELHVTPETSSLYLHKLEPWGDHIYIVSSVDPEEEATGQWVFRDQLPNSFEKVIARMIKGDFAVFDVPEGVMRDQDRFAYEIYLDMVQERKDEEEAERKRIEAPIKPFDKLTPRRERFIQWFVWNIDNNLYNWDEEGDLEL